MLFFELISLLVILLNTPSVSESLVMILFFFSLVLIRVTPERWKINSSCIFFYLAALALPQYDLESYFSKSLF
jgi:hypothetical protein